MTRAFEPAKPDPYPDLDLDFDPNMDHILAGPARSGFTGFSSWILSGSSCSPEFPTFDRWGWTEIWTGGEEGEAYPRLSGTY